MILVDENDEILSADNRVAPFPSLHNIIDVHIQIHSTSLPEQYTFSYRDIKSIDQIELISLLQSYDWLYLDCEDINTKLACLSDNLLCAIDQLAPSKTVKLKTKIKPPWIHPELAELYHKRDALRRRYRRTNDNRFRQEYTELATQVEHLSDQARTAYIQSKISEALQDNKNIWKELRTLGLLPARKDVLHGFTPDVLNAHFAEVSVSPHESEEEMDNIITSAAVDGFTFKEIGLPVVVLAVAHFSSQTVGEDGIPHSIIVKSLPIIGPIFFTHIFNVSLSSSIFPSS